MRKNVTNLLLHGTAVSDGGWGSELLKRGLKIGDNTELWNVTNRAAVLAVAKSYVDAGSDIILTNSFGGNRYILAKHNLETRMAELNQAAVSISKEAAGDNALVFASIGPTGKMISMGEITSEEAYSAFSEQANALAKAGADGLVVETMSDLEEFTAAVKAAKATGLLTVGCMSFDSGAEKDRTMMGVNISEMLEVCHSVGVDMAGANCGVGIENYIKIAENLLKNTKLPVWIKANAGLPVIEDGKTVYKMEPAVFGKYAVELKKLGVRVVGGCCGTTPAHIAGVRKTLESRI